MLRVDGDNLLKKIDTLKTQCSSNQSVVKNLSGLGKQITEIKEKDDSLENEESQSGLREVYRKYEKVYEENAEEFRQINPLFSKYKNEAEFESHKKVEKVENFRKSLIKDLAAASGIREADIEKYGLEGGGLEGGGLGSTRVGREFSGLNLFFDEFGPSFESFLKGAEKEYDEVFGDSPRSIQKLGEELLDSFKKEKAAQEVKETQAATTIQARFRGHQERRALEESGAKERSSVSSGTSKPRESGSTKSTQSLSSVDSGEVEEKISNQEEVRESSYEKEKVEDVLHNFEAQLTKDSELPFEFVPKGEITIAGTSYKVTHKLGEGSYGKVYRLDPNLVLKLEDIKEKNMVPLVAKEFELMQKAYGCQEDTSVQLVFYDQDGKMVDENSESIVTSCIIAPDKGTEIFKRLYDEEDPNNERKLFG